MNSELSVLPILERFAHVTGRIDAAALRAQRDPREIRLMAVSKMVPVELMREAIAAGARLFGENYVQPAVQKLSELCRVQSADGVSYKYPSSLSDVLPDGGGQTETVQVHCIGHLQRNKVREAVRAFDVIETVDRESLAVALADEAERTGIVQEVFVQVNISEEAQKSGVRPEHVEPLCELIRSRRSLRLTGLMCIGSPPSEDDESRTPEAIAGSERRSRREFQQMATLRRDLSLRLSVELPHLSMGMSGDYELAVEEGATIVRLGTLLFGERIYS